MPSGSFVLRGYDMQQMATLDRERRSVADDRVHGTLAGRSDRSMPQAFLLYLLAMLLWIGIKL